MFCLGWYSAGAVLLLLLPVVCSRGPAKFLLVKQSSLVDDSLFTEELRAQGGEKDETGVEKSLSARSQKDD